MYHREHVAYRAQLRNEGTDSIIRTSGTAFFRWGLLKAQGIALIRSLGHRMLYFFWFATVNLYYEIQIVFNY